MKENEINKIILQVMQKTNKEFRQFRKNCVDNGVQFTFDNALKIAFYKEIKIYILNGALKKSYYLQMADMDNILDTLWDRYKVGVIDKCGDHFLEQLLDIHFNNLERTEYRIK